VVPDLFRELVAALGRGVGKRFAYQSVHRWEVGVESEQFGPDEQVSEFAGFAGFAAGGR